MDLKGKTIIITGAARIGQKVAEYLKERGANLVITYFNSESEAGSLGFGVKTDVSKIKDVENVVRVAKEKFGRLDGLVHMAAIYEKTEWPDLDEKAWDKNMNVIAKSSFLFGKIAGEAMLKNQEGLNPVRGQGASGIIQTKQTSNGVKGKMIFFSDWSVLARPYKDHLAYNAAKSAVVGLAKSLAKELAPHILVNVIAPGPIIRPRDLTEEENEEVMANTLLKRWGGPEEIAKGVVYLLESDFVTGHILTIDGGRTIA